MKRGGGKGKRDKGRKQKPPIRVVRLRIRRTTRIIRDAIAGGEADGGSKGGGGGGGRERRADEGKKSGAERVHWEGERRGSGGRRGSDGREWGAEEKGERVGRERLTRACV